MAGSSANEIVKGKQFKATHTWNVLVYHLKENATIKKRILRKSCDHCFTGANAVDVLHHFVKNNPEQFKNSSVSRENIVRLCQSFLDMCILRRIKETDEEKIDKFEDSSAALYVFINESSESDPCHVNGRQVLREIDGDIRNSLDHISISNRSKPRFTKHSSLSIRTKRRPHFPSFHGLGSSSQRNSYSSSEQDEKGESENKLLPPMKRASTLVNKVVKRASSDPNLPQIVVQASSSSENEEEEKKSKKSNIRASVRLRFSQRLSFRKKSVSLNQERNDESYSCATNLSNDPNKNNIAVLRFKQVPISRRSPLKSPRMLKRKISTPTLLSKLIHKTQSYDVTDSHKFHPHNITPFKRHLEARDDSRSPSNSKLSRKDVIKETPRRLIPNRRSNHVSTFSDLPTRVSLRRSLRKSERSSKNDQAYVLTNPGAVADKEESNENKNKLSDAALGHLRRECVRVRLLQLLDLSFVDQVISSPLSHHRDSYNETNSDDVQACCGKFSASFKNVDAAVESGLKLLSRSLHASDILSKITTNSDHDKKVEFFLSIFAHYKELPHQFFLPDLTDLISAVVHALEIKPAEDSLEVIQLLIHLLPEHRIRHLRRVITFLRDVAATTDVSLSSKISNKLLVLQSFSSIIFPSSSQHNHSDLTTGPAGLVRFLIEEHDKAFELPPVVESAIKKKIQLLEDGQIDSPSFIQGFTYSNLIASKDFENQKVDYTQTQINELTKFISNNPSVLSSKKKKDFLKKLQSVHPIAYATLRPVKANHILPEESSKKLPKPFGSGTLPRRRTKHKHTPSM